jgi:N-acetylglucosamine-6-phosphate deacetylase
MSEKNAYIGATIFDGQVMHEDCALLVTDERIDGIVDKDKVGADFKRTLLDGGNLSAGFIDLQVNGGGGILFNEMPTLKGIETICDAHQKFGTTALFPTLITDSIDTTKRAIEAAIQAQSNNIPGFLGLHIEGPHLSIEKKGAHKDDLIRPMTDEDLDLLCSAKSHLDNLLVTLAPESVSDEQVSVLTKLGIRVSLGHSAATAFKAEKFFMAGASSVTHLYNAMSPLTHREPGIVGAALNADAIYCGIIADGFHVAPDAINIALKMKTGEGKLYLVTDAMSTIGTDQEEFTLNGRKILRKNGQLTLSDGTLAGADLDMISAVRFMVENTNCVIGEALRMASSYPADYINGQPNYGRLASGTYGNIVHLSNSLDLLKVWQRGQIS